VAADIPLACSLTADELETRAPEVKALFARATASTPLPDGYVLTFPGDDALAQQLFAFVLSERACCPFFSFALRTTAPHATIQLELRGPASDPDIVKETFAPALALIQS
jgi:hypothetical protein